MRALRIAGLSVALAACHQGAAPAALEPSSHSEFTASLVQASQEVGAGRYQVADRVLADFSTRHPASADAVEAMYWRALYKLDPANQGGGSRESVVLLDNYLASSNAAHRGEAAALRRIATALDARKPAPVTPATDAKPDVAPDKAKDDEIQRLKDELAKANAELERIKRRLAQPKP